MRRERRGFAAVGLYQPKNGVNVGHVLRAAGVFRAAVVAVTGKRFKSYPTDPGKERRHMPLLHVDELRAVIPHDCVPVAVDLVEGATPLPLYVHPERAFYVFGPEDGTLGDAVTSWCRDVIYIPGGSLNLAACVNVVLYDRMTKRSEFVDQECAPPVRSRRAEAKAS